MIFAVKEIRSGDDNDDDCKLAEKSVFKRGDCVMPVAFFLQNFRFVGIFLFFLIRLDTRHYN